MGSELSADPRTPFLPGDTVVFTYAYPAPTAPPNSFSFVENAAGSIAGIWINDYSISDSEAKITFSIKWGIWKVGTVDSLLRPGLTSDGVVPNLTHVFLSNRTWGNAGGSTGDPATSGPGVGDFAAGFFAGLAHGAKDVADFGSGFVTGVFEGASSAVGDIRDGIVNTVRKVAPNFELDIFGALVILAALALGIFWIYRITATA